jgi:hypothetical protein
LNLLLNSQSGFCSIPANCLIFFKNHQGFINFGNDVEVILTVLQLSCTPALVKFYLKFVASFFFCVYLLVIRSCGAVLIVLKLEILMWASLIFLGRAFCVFVSLLVSYRKSEISDISSWFCLCYFLYTYLIIDHLIITRFEYVYVSVSVEAVMLWILQHVILFFIWLLNLV